MQKRKTRNRTAHCMRCLSRRQWPKPSSTEATRPASGKPARHARGMPKNDPDLGRKWRNLSNLIIRWYRPESIYLGRQLGRLSEFGAVFRTDASSLVGGLPWAGSARYCCLGAQTWAFFLFASVPSMSTPFFPWSFNEYLPRPSLLLKIK
jgi:hypothetical protein